MSEQAAATSQDSLYERDALIWAEQQAELLRRLASGENVNEALDWLNVIEEIEAMGRSELRSCGSYLQQAMFHLLKLHAWPDSRAVSHWRDEIQTFLDLAEHCFTPSMRQKIDLDFEYRKALRLTRYAMQETEARPRKLPETCPFTLNGLLAGDIEELVGKISNAE